MNCDCGHSPVLHTDEGGCLFFIDKKKQTICKCMNTIIGIIHRAKAKKINREKKSRKGIKYTPML